LSYLKIGSNKQQKSQHKQVMITLLMQKRVMKRRNL